MEIFMKTALLLIAVLFSANCESLKEKDDKYGAIIPEGADPMDSLAYSILMQHLKRPPSRLSTDGEPIVHGYFVIDTHRKADGSPIDRIDSLQLGSTPLQQEIQIQAPQIHENDQNAASSQSQMDSYALASAQLALAQDVLPPAINSSYSDYGISSASMEHLQPSSSTTTSTEDPTVSVTFASYPSSTSEPTTTSPYEIHIVNPFANNEVNANKGYIQPSQNSIQSVDKEEVQKLSLSSITQSLKQYTTTPQTPKLEHGIPSNLKEEMDSLEKTLQQQSTPNYENDKSSVEKLIAKGVISAHDIQVPHSVSHALKHQGQNSAGVYKNKYFSIQTNPVSVQSHYNKTSAAGSPQKLQNELKPIFNLMQKFPHVVMGQVPTPQKSISINHLSQLNHFQKQHQHQIQPVVKPHLVSKVPSKLKVQQQSVQDNKIQKAIELQFSHGFINKAVQNQLNFNPIPSYKSRPQKSLFSQDFFQAIEKPHNLGANTAQQPSYARVVFRNTAEQQQHQTFPQHNQYQQSGLGAISSIVRNQLLLHAFPKNNPVSHLRISNPDQLFQNTEEIRNILRSSSGSSHRPIAISSQSTQIPKYSDQLFQNTEEIRNILTGSKSRLQQVSSFPVDFSRPKYSTVRVSRGQFVNNNNHGKSPSPSSLVNYDMVKSILKQVV